MPANSSEYQKAYKDRHYVANKQKYIEQAAARKRKLKEEVDQLKRGPCVDCGGRFNPWQMHFDHRPGEEKVACIAHLVRDNRRTQLYKEIAKCDLVCGNCHSNRTHEREQASVV